MAYLLIPLLAAFAAVLTPAPAAGEPSLDTVREVALAHAGLDTPPDRWSARSRWRNAVPQLRATFGRLDQWDEQVRFDEWLATDDDGAIIFDAAKNQDESGRRTRFDVTVQATLDLGGLVFDPHELVSAREERARLDARYRLVELVHATYLERRDAVEDLARLQGDARHHLRRRIRRLEARLDGLTGGWFSTQLDQDGGPR